MQCTAMQRDCKLIEKHNGTAERGVCAKCMPSMPSGLFSEAIDHIHLERRNLGPVLWLQYV